MRLQRAIGGWAAALLVLIASLRPVSAAVPLSSDLLFDWKQGWVESPQWGGRIGYINRQGDLKVHLRSGPAGSWVTVARHVRSFQLLDWSLAVLGNDGTLSAAEGALNAPLEPVAENVCAFQKTLTRLGILQCDGTFLVKEAVASQPRAVAAGIEAFQILDDRAALRSVDGSLWVQEGGVAGNFHKLADRVTSFQLERGWIAYLEPQAAAGATAGDARLMIAEGSLLGSAVTAREVARDVMDFEMEVRVEADANFRRTLYLAVLSRDGVLKIGVGRSLPAELKEFDRGAFCSLGWAGGRLAYLGADGLKVAHFGATGWPESLDSFPGAISSFRMTREGTLLFDSDRGSSKLIDWRQASEEAEPTAQTREDGRMVFLVADASGELAVDAASGDAPGGVESSSIHPHFMRRPVQAILASAGSRVAVRFFSNVPEARAVDAGRPQASSAAAGASKAAPGASSAAKVSHVLPLSQATAVPLYRLYYPDGTDHFYTTNASERDYAKSLGFLDQGVAAYVEPEQIAGTLPFQRFYMGYPRTDHFYTCDAGEAQLVLNFGFTYEGIEGYLYRTQVDGSVPFYRLSWCGGGSSDCDHLYTIDPAERDQVLTWGWGYDGVAGYVWSSTAPPPEPANGAVFVSQSVPASMVLGQSYPVSVTMRNSGTNIWRAAAAYRLGSQNPPDNFTWGIGRVDVPYDVPPGGVVTFTFNVTPSQFGSLGFQWRMVQDGVEWFGDFTPNVSVSVQQPSAGPALYRWYSASSTDHFYSLTDYGTINGFASQGITAYLAPGPGPFALALRRFYNGAPRSEHFYTTDANEAAYVVNTLGFVEEQSEGYLFTTPQPGTVPFYRLAWCSATGDCDHIYTAWASEKDQVVALGWSLDGVVGYVGAPPGGPPPPPGPPPQNDDATFVSQSIPGLMTVSQASTVSITMLNTSSTTWTQGAGYQLSSQNPQDNMSWGLARVDLPSDVAPNAMVTFTFAVTPLAPGLLPFQWRMVHGGSVFGAATQNVVVVVARNPRFLIGVTPYADNYINNFYSLPGFVPPQTSVRLVPYQSTNCHNPYPTTSACYPGVPAWTRDPGNVDFFNPCLAPILTTEVFSAPHDRRDVGIWHAIGKNSYTLTQPNCTPTIFGYVCETWDINYWLIMSDPILFVWPSDTKGSTGSGTSYCQQDQRWVTWSPQGNATREILPGEVTPDSYAMVLDQPDLHTPFRAYVPSGHKLDLVDRTARGDLFWINVASINTSIPVLGATLFGGGFSGPKCFAGEYNCFRIDDRAMAQNLNGVWMITVTGYMTGNDSIFRNTSDALTDLSSLSGNAISNPTVEAIENWMVRNNIRNPVFLGHSLGAMDLTVLYQRGFGSQMILFSAPWVLPSESLLAFASEINPGVPRPVLVYSGTNDTISNMLPVFSGCGNYTDACRRNGGVDLISIDTGGGFLTGNNPHDRCQYQAFYYGDGQCPW